MSDSSFEMSNLAAGKAAVGQLAELLANAEKQIKAVADQKTTKLTKEEQSLRERVLRSAKPLLESLKRNFKSKNYDAMASTIETWLEDSSDDLSTLEKLLCRSLGLSLVASLVGCVDSIKKTVS